jgi:hypothetical protein
MLVAGGWLATGIAWAEPPIEPPQSGPQTGGIPLCQAELAECTINLTDTQSRLHVCEDALADCQATQGQAFPATGQVTCWDSDRKEIPCADTGHDGDIQAGADLSYTDNGLTITDNNTKLEWMKQDDNDSLGTGTFECDPASYPGNLDKDCLFMWDDAFTYVASLNANNYAGYDDWRVPNVKELQSIVNYENDFPAVSAEFDTNCEAGCKVDDPENPENECSCTAGSTYWSSTSNAHNAFAAWLVNFDDGGVLKVDKFNGERVRAVRGPSGGGYPGF